MKVFSSLILCLFFCFSVLYNPSVVGQTEHIATKKQKGKVTGPYYGFLPYVPQKKEYGLEIGSMWEEQTMYWLGISLGYHVGKCFLTKTQTCQQYMDIIGGVGGRDGYTEGLVMLSPRWQFVNYPSTLSHSLRSFVGVMNILDNERNKESFVYGIGYGLSRSIHKNMDIKMEFRIGGGEKTWAQVFVTGGVKLGGLINYFAEKMKRIGADTVEVTSGAIKKTGEVTGGAFKKTGEVTGKVFKSTVDTTSEVTGNVIKSTVKTTEGLIDSVRGKDNSVGKNKKKSNNKASPDSSGPINNDSEPKK